MQCNFSTHFPASTQKLSEDESCGKKLVKKAKTNTAGAINKTADNQGGALQKEANDISSIRCSNPQKITIEQWKHFVGKADTDKSLTERTFGDCGGEIYVYNPTGGEVTILHNDYGEYFDLVKDKPWHQPGNYDCLEIKTWLTGTSDTKKQALEKNEELAGLKPCRDKFKAGAVERVMEAIKEGVFLPPIKISSNRQIVDGNHRYEAATRLGLKTVPCLIGE